jgi:hypothetical protein
MLGRRLLSAFGLRMDPEMGSKLVLLDEMDSLEVIGEVPRLTT